MNGSLNDPTVQMLSRPSLVDELNALTRLLDRFAFIPNAKELLEEHIAKVDAHVALMVAKENAILDQREAELRQREVFANERAATGDARTAEGIAAKQKYDDLIREHRAAVAAAMGS